MHPSRQFTAATLGLPTAAEAMSLRDRFALAAMQGDLAAQEPTQMGLMPNNATTEQLMPRARLMYRVADAMLRARLELTPKEPDHEK